MKSPIKKWEFKKATTSISVLIFFILEKHNNISTKPEISLHAMGIEKNMLASCHSIKMEPNNNLRWLLNQVNLKLSN